MFVFALINPAALLMLTKIWYSPMRYLCLQSPLTIFDSVLLFSNNLVIVLLGMTILFVAVKKYLRKRRI